MDIHAPDKPVHTLKDFAIHIAVVTIGILIALSLEGLREVLHDHTLVRETRENFRSELENNWSQDQHEYLAVQKNNTLLVQLTHDLPDLEQHHPDQIRARVDAIQNANYILTQTTWQSALSTGALAHMSTQEIQSYAGAFYAISLYSDLQARTMAAEDRARAFFDAHTTLSPAELSEGAERILLLARAQYSMVFFEAQVHYDLARALNKPNDRPDK